MFSVSALFYLDVRAARGRAGKDEVNSAGSRGIGEANPYLKNHLIIENPSKQRASR